MDDQTKDREHGHQQVIDEQGNQENMGQAQSREETVATPEPASRSEGFEVGSSPAEVFTSLPMTQLGAVGEFLTQPWCIELPEVEGYHEEQLALWFQMGPDLQPECLSS